MADLQPTPNGTPGTDPGFTTILEALDAAAAGPAGMNFHDGRGALREVLSYADLADQARRLAAVLLGQGLAPGDRVGLVAETEGDFVRAFYACLHAGLVPCPMPLPAAFGQRGAYGETVARIAAVGGVRATVTPEDYREPIETGLRAAGLPQLFTGPLSALDHGRAAPPPPAPAPAALAYLQFSSGTTSAPKGVAVSHGALMANLRGMGSDKLAIGPGDRGVSWLPLYHDMGLVGSMLIPTAFSMSIDFLATRDFIKRPGLWLTMLSRAGGTLSYSPSFGYSLAALRPRGADGLDLSRWRVAGLGGDMIKTATLERFAETFAPQGFRADSFVPSYGMAEVVLGATFEGLGQGCRSVRLDVERLERGEAVKVGPDDARGRAFALCGDALPGHAMALRDDDGRPTPEGRVGRILLRGPSMMDGYFGDPEATSQALDAEGWLDTGDLGCLVDGALVPTGRGKDLIIINGRNIWPQDIEWAVERRVDGLREGGVVAFGAAGGEAVEEEVVVVIEARGGDAGRAAARDGADALLRETLGVAPRIAFAGPGALPRTTSGKLSRATARRMYLAGRFDP
ncbi:MAG: fatty acyl-AMP ligase [Pseudomonadota bacterium]